MKITWCGHSAFLVASDSGLARLLLDPYIPGCWDGALQYAQIRVVCDVILVSHKHDGHFGYNSFGGNKVLIRGFGRFWAQNVHIDGVKTYHDDCQGRERGENTAFGFPLDGIRVAHMGDIGHALDEQQIEGLGDVDVLMIPCGGHSTVDASGALEIVEQLKPRIVLPMHYKTDKVAADLDGLEPFSELFERVETIDTDTLELTPDALPEETTLMVLKHTC